MARSDQERVNILLVDDQPAKLLAYEVILKDLDENLIMASSGREALEQLLRNDIAVVLVDVCMPELDGFELAAMIRDHPRFSKISMIFISAIQVSDLDRLRGYEMGAVDYVPVPVVPEVLRAKVRVFAELHRKTRELERLNKELEERVSARTAELEASTAKLSESETRRSLAIAAGNMGSWDWDWATRDLMWDEGQYRIFGLDRAGPVTPSAIRRFVHPDDGAALVGALRALSPQQPTCEFEFRIVRPGGEIRWCFTSAAATLDGEGRIRRLSGVTIDITARKLAEQRQLLLAREVDHRARNVLTLVQSIVRLTRAGDVRSFSDAVEGRITALARVHTLLSMSNWEGAELRNLAQQELAPYLTRDNGRVRVDGPLVRMAPAMAQTIAMVLHELATNAAKYGALSSVEGALNVSWRQTPQRLELDWIERADREVQPPTRRGFGTKSVIASVETQLGGTAAFDWRTDGLVCRISVPMNAEAGRESRDPALAGSLVA
jgi:PAS domain S-box-containing protein